MRAFLAILVGYALWTGLWLAGGAAIHGAPAEPGAEAPALETMPLLLTLVLSVVCSLVAGAATQGLVRSPSRRPVWILSLLLLATGIGVQASVWSAMPLWFHLAFLSLLVPGCLGGAGLVSRDRG